MRQLPGQTIISPGAYAVTLLWMFVVATYHPACWYIFEGSIGQRLLGLRVVRAVDGQSLTLGAVTIRYMIFVVVTLVIPLAILSAAMANRDPLKRAWHDQTVGSVVVHSV